MLIYFKEKNCPISFYLIIWRKRNVFAGPVEVKGWCWRLVDKNRRKKKKHCQGHAREREARILVSNLLYNSLVIVWTGMVNNWEQWPAPPPVWWLSFSVLGFLIMDCISRRLWASCKATKTRDVFLYEVYRIHVTLAHGRERERERGVVESTEKSSMGFPGFEKKSDSRFIHFRFAKTSKGLLTKKFLGCLFFSLLSYNLQTGWLQHRLMFLDFKVDYLIVKSWTIVVEYLICKILKN